MELDPNFLEFIELLDEHEAQFLVVGGYAVALHGHPRYTADLDVWIWVDPANAEAVLAALRDFGFVDTDQTREDFLHEDRVVQLGFPPLRIDLLTSLDGVEFAVQVGAATTWPSTQVRRTRVARSPGGPSSSVRSARAPGTS